MDKYLYQFGFNTPSQRIGNEDHGWEDESSFAFFVTAETLEEALSWGREVSEAFVDYLFKASDWKGVIPSWKESRFASWIEASPESVFTLDDLKNIPEINVGEMPDFYKWSLDLYGR